MPESNPTSQFRQETQNVAKVCVEGGPQGRRLYLGDGRPGSGDLRPGSRLVLMVESAIGSAVTVTFENEAEPLVGCGSSFRLGAGVPVEFVVDAAAEGEYAFRIDGRGRSVEGCRLVVASDGALDRAGFAIRESDTDLSATLLSYLPTTGAPTLPLEVVDTTGGQARVAVREPGGEPQALEGSASLEIPVSCFGCVAIVSLVNAQSAVLGKGQTGGTEQVEVVAIPPV